MVREIKFRYVIQHKKTKEICFEYYNLKEVEKGDFIKDFDSVNFKIISRDQFTGMKDKNGKEIYEGDILKGVCVESLIMKVIFGNGIFFASRGNPFTNTLYSEIHSSCNKPNNVEIIGNIYENPELLEGFK